MKTSDYSYDLPPEKIAFYPLPQRDQSKLLVFRKGKIVHTQFLSLAEYLPGNAFLFLNNTKVIPARLHFTKASGAAIEIFLLNPLLPSPLLADAMASTRSCRWQCTIGNMKKWNEGLTLEKRIGESMLRATIVDRRSGVVDFHWQTDETFAAIIGRSGKTPLPPYIKREAEASDLERYQTVYSRFDGAVAAPTAGLHFTDEVFSELSAKGIAHDFLTLHVSAGTFQPIKTETAEDHTMHEEQIVVTRTNIDNLLATDRSVIAVGTTSMRTLESLYWYGVKLMNDPSAGFVIGQQDPYTLDNVPSPAEAFKAVVDCMIKRNSDTLVGETSIFIRPGYDFKVCDGLITNFHQPGSTLILLVAAFVGSDWKRIYQQALDNNYRFLSYGDSSLLLP